MLLFVTPFTLYFNFKAPNLYNVVLWCQEQSRDFLRYTHVSSTVDMSSSVVEKLT